MWGYMADPAAAFRMPSDVSESAWAVGSLGLPITDSRTALAMPSACASTWVADSLRDLASAAILASLAAMVTFINPFIACRCAAPGSSGMVSTGRSDIVVLVKILVAMLLHPGVVCQAPVDKTPKRSIIEHLQILTILFMECQRYSDYRVIGELRVSIVPESRTKLGSFKIKIHDHNNSVEVDGEYGADVYPNCEEILEGITQRDAEKFFQTVCGWLEEGRNPAIVYRKIRDYSSSLHSMALEADDMAARQQEMRAGLRESLQNAIPFSGREVINGIEVTCIWYPDHSRYEIYLPQVEIDESEQTVIVGEDRADAEFVFVYAKKAAAGARNAKELLDLVQAFVTNGFQEPKPAAKKVVVPEYTKFEPTRREEDVNGVRIVMTSDSDLRYYLSFPGVNMHRLRNRINPGDGRIALRANPSDWFERAKGLAREGKTPEDIFCEIFNMVR